MIRFTLNADIEPISDFYEQRAVVKNKKTKLYGYINTLGNLAIPCQYTEVGYFSENVVHVSMANSSDEVLIDRAGKTITRLTKKYSSNHYFTNGLAMVNEPKSNKIGFVNTSGELAIPYNYIFCRGFSEG